MNAKQLRNITVLARSGLAAATGQPERFATAAIAELATDLDACESAVIDLEKMEAAKAKEQ